MADSDTTNIGLNPGAQALVQAALDQQKRTGHAGLCVHHWLLALLERHGPMAEAMVTGLDHASLRQHVSDLLGKGRPGAALEQAALLDEARVYAVTRGRPHIGERDLARAILAAAGYQVTPPAGTAVPGSGTASPPTSSLSTPAVQEAAKTYQPRAKRPTPVLEQYGHDLTRAAQEGRLSPLVGRTDELALMVETLCRSTKRNPLLVGPAGVGKTAIVEGLAQRVVSGDVPAVLAGVRIFGLQPSTLVAGAGVVGELQQRIKALLAEAAQDGIILFIDEVHAIIGAGGMPGTNDIASLLKPVLARGEIACIAATTDEEYRRFVEPDSALERRFQPIRVQELSPEQTTQVLAVLRDNFARTRGVQIPGELLQWLVDFSARFLRNRFFPDKAVDLLEQCVAHAIAGGKQSVDRTDAEAVVQRMVGMPLTLDAGLERLKARLADRALLPEEEIETLAGRLKVSLRGLDLRPARPNAVMLLAGAAAANAEAIAQAIAEEAFGGSDRVVTIDFSRFVHPEHVTMLVGSPPGYVGYSDSLPIHRVAQMPWCVVCWQNIHACHPQIREVATQALSGGFLTDGSGKRIYLSDTVVILTAAVEAGAGRALGFGKGGEERRGDLDAVLERELGPDLVRQVDLTCHEGLPSPEQRRRWVRQQLLGDFAGRWQKEGIHLKWDESLVDWLLSQPALQSDPRRWERLVDEQLSPLLVPYLPEGEPVPARALVVKVSGGQVAVEPAPSN